MIGAQSTHSCHQNGAHVNRIGKAMTVFVGVLIIGLLAACGGGTQPPDGGGGDVKVVAAAAGAFHSLALTDEGAVLGWGNDSSGQTGTGSVTGVPKTVPGLVDIVAVAAGRAHSLALSADGTVYAWGDNGAGQLGRAGGNASAPVAVSLAATITAIRAANDTSFALDSDGGLWAWGGNARHLLGDGSTTSRVVPATVAGLPAVESLDASENAVFAVTENEGVWAWGLGHAAMLGTGNTSDQTTPVRVTNLDDYDVVQVAAGSAFAMALLQDGTLVGWGTNQQGQQGRTAGSPTTILVPDEVPDITGVDFLSTGPSTVAVVIDGAVMTWGGNLEGELGIGEAYGHLGSPSTVDIASVISLSLSSSGTQSSVLAVHADGTMSAWGWNAYSQLGAGKVSDSEYSPVAVALP